MKKQSCSPCNNFSGLVKEVKKNKNLVLVGKCTTCNNEFADHTCVKNKCPNCGKKQPSQVGSVKGFFGKKYAAIKFNACKCSSTKRFSAVAPNSINIIPVNSIYADLNPIYADLNPIYADLKPIYADLKPTVCKCGKVICHTENPSTNEVFCGDLACYMKNYYVEPRSTTFHDADINYNGTKLPPLKLASLANTKFCACKNLCEYDLEKNAYKSTCRHCSAEK